MTALEEAALGTGKQGSVTQRLDELQSTLKGVEERVTAVDENLDMNTSGAVIERVAALEDTLFGETQQGALIARLIPLEESA